MIIIGLSLLVTLASLVMMHLSVQVLRLRRLTIPGFWYLSYLMMIFIPSVYLYFSRAEGSRDTALLSIGSALLTVPLGVIFANSALRFRRSEIERYYVSPANGRPIDPLTFLMFSLVPLYFTASSLLSSSTAPLFEMFRNVGQTDLLGWLRQQTYSSVSEAYAYELVKGVFYPYLTALALTSALISRKRHWWAFFALTFVGGAYLNSIALVKGAVAAFLLVQVFSVYLLRSGHFGFRLVVISSAAIFAFPILVLLYSLPSATLLNIADALLARLFWTPNLVAYEYFEAFPGEVGFLHGRSIRSLAWIIGVEHFDTGSYISWRRNPLGYQYGGAGGMFISSFHADFGVWGVILGGLLVGLIMQSIQVYLLRRSKSPQNLAAFAFLFYPFWMLTSRAFPAVLLSTGVLIVMFLYQFMGLISRLVADVSNGAGAASRRPRAGSAT